MAALNRLIYFLPTLVAVLRLRLWFDVFICNYLLGWTVIGWFIALHLACRSRNGTDLEKSCASTLADNLRP